jgi:L-iditol 2-dehydrogenase
MRVAMYYRNDRVLVEEMPVPEIGDDEILVKVISCGICGSDVLEWYRVKTAPRVLGHEIGAVIEKTGKGVQGLAVGDRVFVSHHVPCNTCHYCLTGHHTACETLHSTNFDPGGLAEYVRVPAINVDRGTFRLTPELSYEESALIEPLACVVRGQRTAGLEPGSTVLVVGSGVAGTLHIQLARATGAGRILATDINEYRLEAAARFGADTTIDASSEVPDLVRESNDGLLADLVVLCTGAEKAIGQALQSVERGGTLLFFAVPPPGKDVPVPMGRFWRDEISIKTSYAAAPADIKRAIQLIRSGRIDAEGMVTHRLPLEEVQEAFRLVSEAGKSLKVLVNPWPEG